MPIPHRTQMQIIKRRLMGKEGAERVRELRTILSELPGYRNGPYADLRKWLNDQMDEARTRSRTVQHDSISVRREGASQVALVGPPNAGKSSLLQALSEVQIKIGNYAFTTLRPVPALTRIGGVLVQLVEIPGLIEGAGEDRGGGRALLGVLRGADAMVLCQDSSAPQDELDAVRREIAEAGIELPTLLAATKLDDAPEGALERLQTAVPEVPIVGVSILDETTLETLKAAIWDLTGLIRVYLRHDGITEEYPVALEQGATVIDVAATIHKDIASRCRGAHVWGPSARFEGQQVGRGHELMDGDTVQVIA